MNSLLFPFSPSVSVFVFLLLVFIEIPSSLSNNDLYTQCSAPFVCGKTTVGFPFWGNGRPSACGNPELELRCENNDITKITIKDVEYQVLDINPDSEILKIAREEILMGLCPPQLVNTTFDPKVFELVPDYLNITIFYGCPSASMPGTTLFTCGISGAVFKGGYVLPARAPAPEGCYSSVFVPVPLILPDLLESLRRGFEVKWKVVGSTECGACLSSRGVCGFDNASKQTTCYCPNQSNGSKTCVSPPTTAPVTPAPTTAPGTPAPAEKSSTPNRLGMALGVAGAGIGAMFVAFWILVCIRQKKRKAALVQSKDLPKSLSSKGLASSTTVSQSIPSYTSSKSELQKCGSTYFGVQVFTYEELEKATNCFDSSKELGDGGFGTVYHGVLGDGRVVAVKRLYENNMRRAEQFMNEVEILAHLQHKNLVKLYGCTSRHSRELLLVYEYIPNGTVADHLHGRQSKSGLLPWPARLRIAIETAGALAYLHAKDVIHRDVKTNNILLDNDFHVKVADFGLSRLFPTDVTHVSTAPQGTPGYVDPEYYQCYHLTDKSDVYSFGVVLIELVSALQAVDTSRHRHDINLANMAVNKIQSHALHELVDPSLGFEKDLVVRRMVTSVSELAFRCLQQEREMRPTMDELLAMLRRIEKENFGEGKAEVMDIKDDDVGLLKYAPPPLQFSPDSVADALWISGSSTATPHSY